MTQMAQSPYLGFLIAIDLPLRTWTNVLNVGWAVAMSLPHREGLSVIAESEAF